jgi:iron complex outermembrane recepter protein
VQQRIAGADQFGIDTHPKTEAGFYYALANVQVLNGPHGTLFGRNTRERAILFTPQMPTDRAEGFVEAAYGNYNNRGFSAVMNLPLVPDVLSVRIAGNLRQRDGFTPDISDGTEYDDLNYHTIRAALHIAPEARMTNNLVFRFSHSSIGAAGIVITDINPADTALRTFGLAALEAQLARQQSIGVRRAIGDTRHWWSTRHVMAVNTTSLALMPSFRLKNSSSFQRVRVSGGFDADGSGLPVGAWLRTPSSGASFVVGEDRNDTFTNELQLSGDALGGKLDWLLGGFLLDKGPYDFQEIKSISMAVPSTTESFTEATSKALFGQASLELSALSEALRSLKFTAGYRHTWDERRYTVDALRERTGRPYTMISNSSYPDCLLRYNGNWNAPSFTLALDDRVSPNVPVYATRRTGYKSGGFNVTPSPFIPITFAPKYVTDHEIGLKTDFKLGSVPVRASLAAFYDDYTDVQRLVLQPNPVPGGSIMSFVSNASSATIKGNEAQITAHPVPQLELSANYSYFDAAYKHYIFRDKGTGITADTIGNYTLVNLRATWSGNGRSPVDAELFVTNAFDVLSEAAGGTYYCALGLTSRSYIQPRMCGFRLRYRLGE